MSWLSKFLVFLLTPIWKHRSMILVSLAVLSIYIGVGYVMYQKIYIVNGDKGPTNAGTFGDMFGVVTSFFSATTVILVFYASRLQKQELDATREELRKQAENSKELSNTASKQNLNLILQRFEASFFSLIDMHKKNLENFSYYGNNGRAGIHYMYNKKLAKLYIGQEPSSISENNFNLSREHYNKIEREEDIDFHTNYFGHVVNILNFTEGSAISEDSKKLYLRIFLSSNYKYESVLIYYHICFAPGISLNTKKFCDSLSVFDDLNLKHPSHNHLLKIAIEKS